MIAGGAKTVTTALPLKSAALADPFVSDRLVTVYVVVLVGLTTRAAGLALVVWLYPSDQVTFHGAVPVSAAWIVAALPLQMFVLPLTTAVGRVMTVSFAGGALATAPPRLLTTTV